MPIMIHVRAITHAKVDTTIRSNLTFPPEGSSEGLGEAPSTREESLSTEKTED